MLLVLCFSGLLWGMEGGRSEAEADRNPPQQTAPPGPQAGADAATDGAPQEVLSLPLPWRVGACGHAQDGLAIPSIGVSWRDTPVAPVRRATCAPPPCGPLD